MSNTAGHDTYTHAEDGRVCVLVEDDTWFVPYDVGGEGFSCERRHGPGSRKELARAWSAFLALALEDRLEDGTLVLQVVFEQNPDLRQRLAAAMEAKS